MKNKPEPKPATYEVRFDGGILQRGFWLYVWEITPPTGDVLYYVGRTGDSSSTNAQSPFNRMGQHLGFAKNSNMLRKHLIENGAEPERCTFRLVAVGPIEEESNTDSRHEHDDRRDVLAAMEKALAELMVAAGYMVMNEVKCRNLRGAHDPQLEATTRDGTLAADQGVDRKRKAAFKPNA